jgi:phosphoglycerate dehydrogenase-like enzyme
LTIIGLGATGVDVAKQARAFGMKVLSDQAPFLKKRSIDQRNS